MTLCGGVMEDNDIGMCAVARRSSMHIALFCITGDGNS